MVKTIKKTETEAEIEREQMAQQFEYDMKLKQMDVNTNTKKEAQIEFNILPIDNPISGKYDAILLTVAHDEFKQLSVEQIKDLGKSNHVLYDVKCLLKANDVDGRL